MEAENKTELLEGVLSADSGISKLKLGLHPYHWLIIVASLVLSVIVWRYTRHAHDQELESRFTREADRTVALVEERMRHYEDALLSGVATINTLGGDTTFEQWKSYANSLDLAERYPGINGIGVIHAVQREGVESYLAQQRIARPNFRIHPEHNGNQLYPITYVVPTAGNEKAVGLDIAFEENRFRTATQSRETGNTQITGPIALVQDNQKTPGFLLYAPFYRNGEQYIVGKGQVKDVDEEFGGFVYAPFVVRKLIKGTLERSNRHVGIRLYDGDEILYDEHLESEPDFDSDPLLKKNHSIELFGRVWRFEIWTTTKFRNSSFASQPALILLGGLIIDGLLLYLFLSMNRASRKTRLYLNEARSYANEASRQLALNRVITKKLERSNAELEQFACVASHDLQEPLRKVSMFCGLLGKEYANKLDDEGRGYLRYAIDGARRMRQLITDLLNFSRVGSEKDADSIYPVQHALDDALANLKEAMSAADAEVVVDPLPQIVGNKPQMSRLLQNLVGNGLKYRSDEPPKIHVGVVSDSANHTFSVRDNGIGIEPQNHQQVFGIFKRLHSASEYEGTGIGLAICQRIVESWDGKIWIDPEVSSGTKFCFTVPVKKQPMADSRLTAELIS